MMKRLVVLPILAFALVLLAPSSAYACGGAGQACCSGNVCTSPAFCDPSTICVLPDQQACTSDSDCSSGQCEDTSATPTCGSLERLSDTGQACTADADCEPATYCSALNVCTAAFVAGAACARPRECISFQCDNITQTCLPGIPVAVGDGCITTPECHDASMTCCHQNQMGCPSDACVNDDGAGFCCFPSGSGGCSMANELFFCCSGSCNGGGTCN